MSIRKNPPLMRELIEEMDYMVRVMDEDDQVIYMNRKMREEFGHTLGNLCYKLLGRKEKCENCVTRETKKTGKPGMKDVPIDGKYYNIISSPVNIENGTNYSIELFRDITEQKKIEDKLMMHYEKLKEDIEFAKHIQKSSLPADGVYWESLEINSMYCPSEDLGGDLFDVIKMNDTEVLLYIADVSGHGITSSLLTIFLRQMVRGRVGIKQVDLNEIFGLLLKSYNELGIDSEQYLTILFCLYNKEKKEITFLNAGHNCLPILVKGTGEVREIVVKGLPVCTLIQKSDQNSVTVSVESGDRVILYTDGITEVFNEENQPYNSERVLRSVENHINLGNKALARKIVHEVEAFTQKPATDDMAIIIAKLI